MTQLLNEFRRWQRSSGEYGSLMVTTDRFVWEVKGMTGNKAVSAAESLSDELMDKGWWSARKHDWNEKAFR